MSGEAGAKRKIFGNSVRYDRNIFVMDMHMRVLAVVLLLFVTGCANILSINHLARAEAKNAAYLYQFPGYFPTISGDGNTIVAPTDSAIWLWRAGQKAQTIIEVPAGYHSGYLAVSSNGETIAGTLVPNGEELYPQVFYPGRNNRLFLWQAGTGIKMLPEIPATDHIGGFQVNDTGSKIFFGCVNNHLVPGLVVACKDGPFQGSKNFPYLKQWTSAQGYKNITLPKGNPEKLDSVADDFQSYLIDDSLSGTGCRTFLETAEGKKFPIPSPGNYRPCLTLYSSPDNRYFAEEVYPGNDFLHADKRILVVWDAKGNEAWRSRPLSGCSFGLVAAIDDLGNIYAQEQCFNGKTVWTEGVRITASGTETLKHWLEAAGAGSSLPLDLIVNSVSANGETIYGSEFDGIAVGSAGPSSTQTGMPDAPPGSRPGFEPGIPFIAHVP